MPRADPTAAVDYLRQPRRGKRPKSHWWKRWLSRKSNVVISKQVDAGLRGLFQSSYWERLWIIQEVCLAKDLVLFCGAAVMTWPDIKELVGRIKRSDTLYDVLDDASDDTQDRSTFDMARMISVEDARERLEPQPLGRVVSRFQASRVSGFPR